MKIVLLVSGKIGSGKNTVVDFIKEILLDKMENLSFAGPIKDLCAREFSPLLDALKVLAPNLNIGRDTWYENKTFITRTILQIVGTNIVRKIDSDYWTNQLITAIKASPAPIVTVSDWRFPSEYFLVGRENAFETLTAKVIRPPIGDAGDLTSAHVSETALDGFMPTGKWDFPIYNDADLNALRVKAHHVADALLERLAL